MTADSANEPAVLLPWDTDFWGFPVGRVRGDTLTAGGAAAIDAWARAGGVRCLYFLARSDDAPTVRVAQDNGYRFVDARVTFRQRLRGTPPVPAVAGIAVRDGAAADGAVLGRIARGSYRDTRFSFDDGFPKDRADALYVRWIGQNCESDDTFVLIAEGEGRPVGYISGHRAPTDGVAGSIVLVGVHPEARGVGVGQLLVQAALARFAAEGRHDLSVVTQGRNDAAQRLYQRNGFLTSEVRWWFHRWYASLE